MNRIMSKFFGLVLASAAVLAGGSAHAGYAVQIYQDNVLFATVSGASQTVLSISGNYGTDFDLSGLILKSTATGVIASLSASGSIVFEGVATHTLKLIVSDDNVPTPLGGSYKLGSVSSYSVSDAIAGDTYKFQSFAGVGGTLYDMSLASSPGHTFAVTTSGNFTEALTAFSATPAYTLTQVIEYTASPGGLDFNLTGNTTAKASAVPEPGSMALLGMGIAGMVGMVRRRRRVVA